ncbi:ATP-binding response regulator [Sphingobacterium sp. SYP-B4668]|uniref:ATP-binding response regulator n=1 Tax=Sphingobacterium sp. SYP-B4668 TaxID=2996035 RepID=UPI0022DCECFF|nr:ATP-binding protein [Sphingobacterium sp. SYP-B4668]
MAKTTINTFLLRKILIYSIVLSFLFLSAIFIFQYSQYKRVEQRLSAAYASGQTQSVALYSLFSTYNEAENLFRMYTVDFKKETYQAYKDKLDTIKYYVDSLSALPIENNPLHNAVSNVQLKGSLAMEFATLKKNVDNLIFFAKDSLPEIGSNSDRYVPKSSITIADSVVSNILQDSVKKIVKKDTVVKKKDNLFKRIFNAKNDTIVANTLDQQFNVNQIDVMYRNIKNVLQQNDYIYSNNIRNLREMFLKVQQKERELILSNNALLNNLKNGIDRLKELEMDSIRKAEEIDFSLYRKNSQQFGYQLIAALSIMFLMIIFIIYYQSNAVLYEKRLFREKEYVAKIAEEKTSVLANISHEIRTPVNSLLGVIDIMKKNNQTGKVDEDLINSASYEITVINSTINDILNLSKLEVGSLKIVYDYFSPHRLLHDLIGLHGYQAKSKGLSFTNQITIDPKLKIYSNAFRIKQIASNFISNAIKYTKKGNVNLSASIKQIKDKHSLFIEVSDTGIGISDDNKSLVFRKYYVADTENKVSGFGLGLYISKLLSEQLNADISFKSRPDTGTTFTLTIPYDKQLLSEKEIETHTIEDLPKNLNIVIIDDSRINILYLQQFFGNNKNIHTFNNGREGLDFILSNQVDIVITDLIMPEVSGWDILAKIKGQQILQHVKVIAFTAEKMLLEDDHRNKKNYSFDGVLSKPLNENELVSAILKGIEAG